MPSIGSLSLSPSQRAALDQLRAITSTNPTGQSDGESDMDERTHNEIAVLESVQWDVERAANAIFSQPPAPLVKASTSNFGLTSKPTFEPFQVDDTAQGQNNTPRPPPTQAFPIRIFLSLLSLASFPLTLTFSIISHVFRFLRIPLPRAPGLSLSLSFVGLRNLWWPTGSSQHGRIPDDPFLAAERLVRNLEEETGAISISRARASMVESASAAGPSSAPLPLNSDPTRKVLPDFHFGSYESALKLAQRDARPLCVVLLSDEHDDTPAFQHNVLTDPEFVRVLTEGEFIVWAGDIRGAEGYQASLKLTATTYPFVAFIGLQPRLLPRSQTTNSSSGQTSLTILSRHPSTNTPAPLTSQVLITHITTTIIPRITPLRLQALAREEERRLREEQDAAFLASERADAERIRRRRTEEEQARERAVLEGERTRKAEQEARTKALEEERYKNWLGWSVSRMNHEPSSGSGIRVGVRMPDGKRTIRRFSENDEVDSIYIWVGGMLYGVTEGTVPDGSYEPSHRFTLAVAFPRSEVPFVKGQKIGEVGTLKGGANLVVEGFMGNETDDGSESEDEGE